MEAVVDGPGDGAQVEGDGDGDAGGDDGKSKGKLFFINLIGSEEAKSKKATEE